MTVQMPLSTASMATPIHDAASLTGANGLAHIQLGDQLYTLRITKSGKLLLTK